MRSWCGIGAAIAVVVAAAAAGTQEEDDGADLVAHLIPHSHCDPGWLSSFEGYYSREVAVILTEVTRALAADPARRFVWAESSFFMRWYESQSAEVRDIVRELVASGRIEFVGGGWVQNDEANPTPDAVLSQITEGHEYLLSLFGVRPRIAVQFDPFGHAAATAAIAAMAGYDALVINRIDYSLKDALKARAAMEFVWQPYASAATAAAGASDANTVHMPYANASIFTHVLHTHYSAPRGYDFENGEGFPVTDDSVASRAQGLAEELRRRAQAYRTRHLLVPFGDDFKFKDAKRQFDNMDRIVKYVTATNRAGNAAATGPVHRLRLRYSTLSEYFDAVWLEAARSSEAPATAALPTVNSVYFPVLRVGGADGGVDFFPYADNGGSWWVGYYVSRPLLKQLIRRAGSTLRGAEVLLSLVRPWAGAWQREAAARLAGAAAAANATYALAAVGQAADALAAGTTPSAAVVAAAGYLRDLSAAPYARFSWLAAFQRLEQARLDAALCLHHDAITGTSQPDVVSDYSARMVQAVTAAVSGITDVASLLLGGLPRAQGVRRSGMVDPRAWHEAATVTLGPAPLTHVPHILPVAARVAVRYAMLPRLRVLPSTPAQPVVIYNPTAWRRRAIVTLLVDVGSALVGAGAAARQNECRRRYLPHALVVDDAGLPLQSQWLSTVESGGIAAQVYRVARDLANGTEAGTAGAASNPRVARARKRLAGACTYGDASAVTERVWWDAGALVAAADADTSAGESSAAPLLHDRVRYELAVEVDVPAYGLTTAFVTVAWQLDVEALARDASGGGSAPAGKSSLEELARRLARRTATVGCGITAGSNPITSMLAAHPLTAVLVPGLGTAAASLMGGSDSGQRRGPALPPRLWALDPASRAVAREGKGGGVRVYDGAISMLDRVRNAPEASAAEPPIILENACLAVAIDPRTGLIASITAKHAVAGGGEDAPGPRIVAATTVQVQQAFGAYHTQQSGAYLFRPTSAATMWDHATAEAGSGGAAPSGGVTVSVTLGEHATLAVHSDVYEPPSGVDGDSEGDGGGLVQTARVVTPRFSQTVRLTDTLGWHRSLSRRAFIRRMLDADTDSEAATTDLEALIAACNDPLVPDAAIEVRPTIAAEGNEEVVMQLETNLDIAGGRGSTNLRDLTHDATAGASGPDPAVAAAQRVAGDGWEDAAPSAAACSAEAGASVSPPRGWWTGDGLGLLRRPPAPLATSPESNARYFYPLNTLTRIAGAVSRQPTDAVTCLFVSGAAPFEDCESAMAEANATAWLTVMTAQPLGVTAHVLPGGRSRLQIMLHRHTMHDDGRGLGVGLVDTTVVTSRLSFSLASIFHPRRSDAGDSDGDGGGTVPAPAAAVPPGITCDVTTGELTLQSREHALVHGLGVFHPDWTWAWGTRSAVHHLQPVTLFADLEGIYQEEAAAEKLHARRGSKGAAGAPRASAPSSGQRPVAPPLDTSTHLASAAAVASEAAMPRWAWMARYATRFAPMSGAAWAVPTAPRSRRHDAYPHNLAKACGGSGDGDGRLPAGLAPLCHHLGTLEGAHDGGGGDEAADSEARHAGGGGAAPDRVPLWPGNSPHNPLDNAGRARDGLPPWLHVMSLQVRDAVTDDTLLRLHNFGGPDTVVQTDAAIGAEPRLTTGGGSSGDAAALAASSSALAADELEEIADAADEATAAIAYRPGHWSSAPHFRTARAPLALTNIRRRTASLNRPVSYLRSPPGGRLAAACSVPSEPTSGAGAVTTHFSRDGYFSDGTGADAPPCRLAFPTQAHAAGALAPAVLATFPLALAPVATLLRAPSADVRKEAAAFMSMLGAAPVIAARLAASAGMDAAALGSYVNQNTEEAGVFLSDAALAKMRADAGAAGAGGIAGRMLLAAAGSASAGGDDGHSRTAPLARALPPQFDAVPPATIATLVAALEPHDVPPLPALPAAAAATAAPATGKQGGGSGSGGSRAQRAEARADLLSLIDAVVVDPILREAMKMRVRKNIGLTKAQEAMLRKLERTALRAHNQTMPDAVPSILARVVGGGDGRIATTSPPQRGPGRAVADGDEAVVPETPPPRLNLPDVVANNPWAAEAADSEEERALLARLAAEAEAALEQAEVRAGAAPGGRDDSAASTAKPDAAGAHLQHMDGQRIDEHAVEAPLVLGAEQAADDDALLTVSFAGVVVAAALFIFCGGAMWWRRFVGRRAAAPALPLPVTQARPGAAVASSDVDDHVTTWLASSALRLITCQCCCRGGLAKRLAAPSSKTS